MKRTFSALIIALVVAVSLSGTLATVANARTYPGDNGKIFYTTWGTGYPGNTSIRSVNPDGSDDTLQIDHGVGFELSPPSSDKIVYEEYVGPLDERLMVANRDGSDATQIPLPGLRFGVINTFGDAYHFSFVNDNEIVFSAASIATGNTDIYRVNIDGTGLTKITTATPAVENRYANPVVSPSGDRMIIEAGANIGARSLNIMDMAGNITTVIPSSSQMQEADYSWSPDGSQVIVTEYANSNVTVSVYNVSGATATLAYTVQPSNVSSTIYDATFSPNGQYIALVAPIPGSELGASYIWTVPVGGPTGSAQQVLNVGVQSRGSGGSSWVDWVALPVTAPPTTPANPTTPTPGAPNTGLQRDDGALVPLLLLVIGTGVIAVLIGRRMSKRRV